MALPLMVAAQPVIRVTTNLVDISLIARDSKGLVPDLTQSDFVVFDNGIERPIAFFSAHSTRRPSDAMPLPPNVFTNHSENRNDAAARLTVFVIDLLNTEFDAQVRVRQQLLKYAARIGPRDRAAVWVMSDRLRCIQDFTNDGKQLAAAVERVKPNIRLVPEMKLAIANHARSRAADALDSGVAKIEEVMQYYRMQLTNDMLKDLGEALARIPGRKNMVWLSSGFPVNMSLGPGGPEKGFVQGRLTGTGRALARGNIALYPVDAKGLVAPQGGQNVLAVSSAERERHATMDIIAAATGGCAFYDTNDLAGAVGKAVDDAEVTYTIGFYPAASGEDGEYHRLHIEVKRRGIHLRYREGYVRVAAAEMNRRDDIHNALVSPLELPGIPLSVRLEPLEAKRPGWQRMTIAIPEDGVTRGEVLDLVVSQRAADGRELAVVSNEERLKDASPLHRQVHLAPGVTRIRIVAYERSSGRVGSVDLPLRRK